MNATTVAVDLAKTVFDLAISDEQGRLVERKRLSREGFARFFVNRPSCRPGRRCGVAALTKLIAEIRTLDTRIAAIEQQLREQAKPRPEVQRLMTAPSMGLLIATALIAAVGGMTAFRDGVAISRPGWA